MIIVSTIFLVIILVIEKIGSYVQTCRNKVMCYTPFKIYWKENICCSSHDSVFTHTLFSRVHSRKKVLHLRLKVYDLMDIMNVYLQKYLVCKIHYVVPTHIKAACRLHKFYIKINNRYSFIWSLFRISRIKKNYVSICIIEIIQILLTLKYCIRTMLIL